MRPGYEILFHRHHTEMSQQQTHLWRRETVDTRYLEMWQGLQRTTHVIGITIESHDYRHRVVRILFVDTTYLMRHDVSLIHIRISLKKLQVAYLLLRLVLR